jgi:hypothetical protein
VETVEPQTLTQVLSRLPTALANTLGTMMHFVEGIAIQLYRDMHFGRLKTERISPFTRGSF